MDKTERPGVPGEALVGPPPLLAAETAAPEGGEGAETDDASTPAVPAGPTPEELAAEAAKINAATGPWIFALPSWKASAFKLKLDDVLAPLPAAEEPPLEELPADEGLDGGVSEDVPPAEEVPPPAVEVPTGNGDGTAGG